NPNPPEELLVSLDSNAFKGQRVSRVRTDLSFVYSIVDSKNERYNTWHVMISMVGRYAVVFRLLENRHEEFVTVPPIKPWHREKELTRLLTTVAHPYRLLSKSVLSCKSPLDRLLKMRSGETITYWPALFRDERGFPWDDEQQSSPRSVPRSMVRR